MENLKKLFLFVKNEYGPYRYYVSLYVLFVTTFTGDLITYTRILRFIITCVVLGMFKKLHEYFKKNKCINTNIKMLILLMWINVLQNPILYIIGKGDLYIYEKFKNIIDKNIKNVFLNNMLILLFGNITMPIKIIYMRFYMSLNVIKTSTFKDFMFNRIYGLLLSILFFSNIIQYLYEKIGCLLNFIIIIYIILYSINIIYIISYKMSNKACKKEKNWLQNFLLKTGIYKIVKDYVNTLNVLEINEVYEAKIQVSLISNVIKNHIKNILNQYKKSIDLENVLDMMPEQWRFWIYNAAVFKKHLFNHTVYYISYRDGEILAKTTCLKINNILNHMFNGTELRNKTDGYEIYFEAMSDIRELFTELESALYYKYCVFKTGVKKKIDEVDFNIISINLYQDIYQMNLLILKTLLFYIGDFEYFVFRDLNKLTKGIIIEDVDLEYGYHISTQDIDPYDPIILKVNRSDFINSTQFNNERMYEMIYILSRLSGLLAFSTPDANLPSSSLLYIYYKENKPLKNIIKIQNKFSKVISGNDNDLSLLKTDIADEYFQELKDVMNSFYQEWLNNCENTSNQNLKIFQELVQHFKKTTWEVN